MRRTINAILGIALCLSLFTVSVSGKAQHYFVKYNKSLERSDSLSSGAKIRVFYDYGTILPGDNANLLGTSRYNKRNYVGIFYSKYGSRSFVTERTTTYGEAEARKQYNPFGVDYVEPDSFVQSEGDYKSGFLMKLKVTR